MGKIEDVRIIGLEVNSIYSTLGGDWGIVYWRYLKQYQTIYKKSVAISLVFSEEEQIQTNFKISLPTKPIEGMLFIGIKHKPIDFSLRTEEEIRAWVAHGVLLALTTWSIKMGIPQKPLQLIDIQLKKKEYFLPSTKEYKLRRQPYICWIEYRRGIRKKAFRLVVQNLATTSFSYYFVCSKEYFQDHNLKEYDYSSWMEQATRTLEPVGWISKSEFEMRWGDERYIFDLDREEVSLISSSC